MSSRSQHHTPQSSFSRSEGERQYQRLEQIILDETGIACSVLVTPHAISIRAKDYREYVQARAAIRGRVSIEIVRDE